MMTNKITGFYLLFATQYILVACKIFMEVKVGLFFLILSSLFTAITLIQLSNSPQTDWKVAGNGMTVLYSIWALYCIFEVANPNCVIATWNICIMPYALLPVICAILTPLVVRETKHIEWLLFIWSAFIIIATLKGLWQQQIGFSERDRYFLYALGGRRTHIIWSGIRYFSCFSDANNYGTHSAMAAVTFIISSFYMKEKWKRIYFILVGLGAIYGLGISGTRSAMAVIAGGLLMVTVISKSWKTMLASGVSLALVFSFFYFTHIGNGNAFIYKMRSAFHPTEDASYMLRVENRARMKELMVHKPIGYGLGLSKLDERNPPKEVMPYPPDSWLVSVWVETGIIGLILYLTINGCLFVWSTWILLFRIKDKRLRGLLSAWLATNAGFFIAAYAADNLQYPNTISVYVGFALCFAATQIDKHISEKRGELNKIL